jgi:hypothetical protein
MKSFLSGSVFGLVFAVILVTIYALATTGDLPALKGPDPSASAPVSKGVLDLICELQVDLDAQLELGVTNNELPRINLARIDFDKRSGWYQGKITISENRAGNLEFDDRQLTVSRPAMIRRFNRLIRSEQFTIDRRTGAFSQSLTMDDGKTINLIRGSCALVKSPPL